MHFWDDFYKTFLAWRNIEIDSRCRDGIWRCTSLCASICSNQANEIDRFIFYARKIIRTPPRESFQTTTTVQLLDHFSSEHMIKNLIKVCLVLLLANSMRIFFRYGKVYEDALLLQSLIMIIAMIVLTELCVRTNRFKSTKQHRIAVFTEVLVRRDSMTISVFRVSCPEFQIFRHVIDTKCRNYGFSPNNRL